MDASFEDEEPAEVLTEERLRYLARNIRQALPAKQQRSTEGDKSSSQSIFQTLFRTAEARNINAAHRVAAWNALCSFIDHWFDHENDLCDLRDLSERFWKRAFDLYLNHSQNARPKSSKQLLSTLGTALQRTDRSETLRPYAEQQLIEGITNGTDPSTAKACLQLFAHLLSKRTIGLADALQHLPPSRIQHCANNSISTIQEFLRVLLAWVGKGDLGSVVAHCLSVTLAENQRLESVNGISTDVSDLDFCGTSIWIRPLEDIITNDAVQINALRIHILPVVFKRDLLEYVQFLDRHGFQNLCNPSIYRPSFPSDVTHTKDGLLFAALQSGKELGLLRETDELQASRSTECVFLPIRFIRALIQRSSRPARLAGLSLLITSRSATSSLSTTALTVLRKHLHVFFADTDANFRSEVLSLMQKLIDRFRSACAALARSSHDTARTSLQLHRDFLEWLLDFLASELRPTASYQRHISALKTLMIVSRSGLDWRVPAEALSKSALADTRWPFHLRVVTPGRWRLLQDLLLNPFDDVRQTSASILDLHRASEDTQEHGNQRTELRRALGRAENLMLLTGRADQADGVAHFYALLYRQSDKPFDILSHILASLRRTLEIANSNLPAAVSGYPIHGLLISLRYIISQAREDALSTQIVSGLTDCLQSVWNIVSPILCEDAPEGYLPEEFDESSNVTTKDTLSYCWRALKESSLLLGAIISNAVLERSALVDLSDLCFRQLAELRHRGAFSTVSQTWILCCMKCNSLSAKPEVSLLRDWYVRAFALLTNRTTINTRRSAGIPALLCGLLIADKNGSLLSEAFEDLTVVARQPVDQHATGESSLPQVHALNCMKDILKNTRLGEQSQQYVPICFHLAADALQSEAWAVRNCGLMLFRAVIDRLLGTSESHLDGDGSANMMLEYNDFAGLLELVLDLLNTPEGIANPSRSQRNEGVFPALQLLQRMNIPAELRSRASKAILTLTRNSSWHIRDKAARTYARTLPLDDFGVQIEARIKDVLLLGPNQNALHGTILCLKYLLRELHNQSGRHHLPRAGNEYSDNNLLPEWTPALLSSVIKIYQQITCSVSKAACIDTILECEKFIFEHGRRHNSQNAAENPTADALNIWQELIDTLTYRQAPAGIYVLRSALARVFAFDLIHTERLPDIRVDPTEEVESIIVKLASRDADACRSFLEACDEDSEDSSAHTAEAILSISIAVIRSDVKLTLKTSVQRLVLNLAGRWREHDGMRPIFRSLLDDSSSPLDLDTSQEYADQWLQLQAIALECSVEDNLLKSHHPLSAFVRNCCDAVNEKGIFSREAAAFAIRHLQTSWQRIDCGPQKLFSDLCFAVYDLLNDDDEDIRILASTDAASVVALSVDQGQGVQLEPLCATERLALWMVRKWPGNLHFIAQASLRAFGFDQSKHATAVAQQLPELEKIDSSLFAEEKQNLYIDDAREARFWSRVLLKTDVKCIPRSWIRSLATWVSQGLDTLVQRAAADNDGALGWTTKPAVFTLGLRVVYAAEFLLHVVEQGVRLTVAPSELRLKLGRLRVVGEDRGFNSLWIREMDRVMASAIGRGLQRRLAVMDLLVHEIS